MYKALSKPSTMMIIIQAYENYLKHIGYKNTSTLVACVRDFMLYHQIKNIHHISPEHILTFYDYIQHRPQKIKQGGLSESFVYHHIYSLKVFFDYLEQTAQITINPINHLQFKKPKNNTRDPLSQEQIQQLFEATKNIKEKVILHLFYSCGLRRTEAEHLNTIDLHLSKRIVYVRKGKNAKRRAIPITKAVCDIFESYLQQRINPHDQNAFVLNNGLRRMQGESFNWLFKRILKRTAFYKDLSILAMQEPSIHHLRHSIATHLLENGLSIQYVKEFLGHAFLESTQLYAKVSQQQLKKLV
jgi:integrase/recombinase XerD